MSCSAYVFVLTLKYLMISLFLWTACLFNCREQYYCKVRFMVTKVTEWFSSKQYSYCQVVSCVSNVFAPSSGTEPTPALPVFLLSGCVLSLMSLLPPQARSRPLPCSWRALSDAEGRPARTFRRAKNPCPSPPRTLSPRAGAGGGSPSPGLVIHAP